MVFGFLVFFLAFGASIVFGATTCGDGTCEEGENQCTCSQDCGTCSGSAPEAVYGVCKELYCGGVSKNVCSVKVAANCCGNLSCETGEGFATCSTDCTPTTLTIQVVFPPTKDYNILYGETITVGMHVKADDINVQTAEGVLKTPWGLVPLFNDGKHKDGTPYDAVYANTFTLPPLTPIGKVLLTLESTFLQLKTSSTLELNVSPFLDLDTAYKDVYTLGENMVITGSVHAHDQPVSMALDYNLVSVNQLIASGTVNADAAGNFSIAYHTSTIDPLGKWELTLKGTDSNANEAYAFHVFEVSSLEKVKPLEVHVLTDLNASIPRGKVLALAVEILGVNETRIEGAQVTLETPLNEHITLVESTPGTYTVSYIVPYDLPVGKNALTFFAQTTQNGVVLESLKEIQVGVEAVPLRVELVEPANAVYAIGEWIPLQVSVEYPSKDPVSNASVNADFHARITSLTPEGHGLFSGQVQALEGDEGVHKIIIEVSDGFGNTALEQTSVEVSGVSIGYVLQKNAGIWLVIMALAGMGVVVGRHLFGRKAREKRLQRRKRELEGLLKELEWKYFEQGDLGKKEYEHVHAVYENDLNKVEEELKRV